MAEQHAIFQPALLQVGDAVGSLLLLETFLIQELTQQRRYWKTRCLECNRERVIRADGLFRFASKPCQCQPIAGDVIGTLQLMVSYMDGPGRRMWVCRCVTCGNERTVRLDHLIRFSGKPCKCQRPRTHGLSKTKEYAAWTKMLLRCYDPTDIGYSYYGEIGRYVCQRWRESVEAFVEDMGTAPSIEHSIDRVNTHGSYTCGKCDECREKNQPFNCRWATKDVQARNAKNNRYYTHDGKTLILKDWARLVGIDYHALFSRIDRGWSFERAISTPSRHPS